MFFATLLLAFLLPVADCGAQDPGADCTLTAQRTQGSIIIDGLLTEPDWETASVATGFRQFEPNEGDAPSQRTEVRVLYGASSLFVGATMYDDTPEDINRVLSRRDQYSQADRFTVWLDSYFDRKTAYAFAVNAAGVQIDGVQTDYLDESWDAVWYSDVQITDEGWVVEMEIPYSMLRFSEADVQQWGINFRRDIPRRGEITEWSLVRRTERDSGPVSHFGILDGLTNLRPRRNIQITPYSVARVQMDEAESGGVQSSETMDVGGDVKVGISSNFTLDATINPDFGQVESDPAQLNLTAFETFFSERRPFFTEGFQIFEFNLNRGNRLLYTRRIGSAAPIIGAVKVSGRTGRGLSVGVLGAATGNDFSPGRLYGVGRLRQEIGRTSSVGGIFTGFANRTTEERQSAVGGFDWDIRLRANTYRVSGQMSGTYVKDPGLDAENGYAASIDFAKIQGLTTASTGFTLYTEGYNPNDLGRLRRDDYFNINGGVSYQLNGGQPFGPFRRADVRISGGNGFSYRSRINQGFGVFASSDFETHDFQRVEFDVFTDYLFGGYDVRETRGLGPRARPREARFSFEYRTDDRRAWRLNPEVSYQVYSDGGSSFDTELDGRWNVSTRFSLSASAEYGQGNNEIAWAANEAFSRFGEGWAIGLDSTSPDDLTDTDYQPFDDGGVLGPIFATMAPYDADGLYYASVFGARDTRSFDFTLRGNITFTPTLSLQLYGQLFTAKGRYDDFSIVQDRDTLVRFDALPKRYDFAFSSFQTNTVLRWEYRPGSTLFVVWSQARNGDNVLDPFELDLRSPYNIATSDQLIDTFGIFPTNIFLVKVSYKFLR